MRTHRILGVAGPAAIVAAALLVSTVTVRPAPAGRGIEVTVVAKAAAFDPVGYVWRVFRDKVLRKVFDFIRRPFERAKAKLQSIIHSAIEKAKAFLKDRVIAPAMRWALEHIFPAADKILTYVQQKMGDVDNLMKTGEHYAAAVDAAIMGKLAPYKEAMGGVSSTMELIQKFHVSMVVDVLVQVAKEKIDPFIKSKVLDVLNWAWGIIEGPIMTAKAAVVSLVTAIPIVGGVLAAGLDLLLTKGLQMLKDKGFAFIQEKAVELGNKAIDWIGSKLRGVAARADDKIAPILDRIRGFVAKAEGVVAKVKDAFARVNAGLDKARSTLNQLRAKAQGLAGGSN